jgi:hypothetical protein
MKYRVADNPGRRWLMIGGWMSIAASLLHIGCIFGGPVWYRFFGAGEQIARMAERGHWYPAVITSCIAAILAGWAAYAFSAAGRVIRLPLMRVALVAISAVLVARGILGFTPVFLPIPSPAFKLWSSVICLLMGLSFSLGTWRAWPALSQRITR